MRVLGIDPGLRATGYGILEEGKRVLDAGTIRPRGDAVAERLYEIYNSICELIDEWQPDWAAIEEVIYHKNVSSALLLGAARGVTLLALHQKGVKIREFSPTSVKLIVAGNGRASKEQVAYMVRKMLNIEDNLSDHATDALAVALALTLREGNAILT